MTLMERVSPTGVSRSVFASVMRLSGGIGLFAGFYLCYSRSISAFTLLLRQNSPSERAWNIGQKA